MNIIEMLKETYRYIVAIFMIFTLYNIPKAHSKICTSETRRRGPHPQGICGDRISEILGLYCGPFGYNSRVKRDIAKEKERNQLDDVTVSRETANAYLMQKKMRWHDVGIVCECCYHSCTGPEILSYCLAPFTSFRKRGDQILKRSQELKLQGEAEQQLQHLEQQQHLELQQQQQQQQHPEQQQQQLEQQQKLLQQHIDLQQLKQQHLEQQQKQQQPQQHQQQLIN